MNFVACIDVKLNRSNLSRTESLRTVYPVNTAKSSNTETTFETNKTVINVRWDYNLKVASS